MIHKSQYYLVSILLFAVQVIYLFVFFEGYVSGVRDFWRQRSGGW